MGKPKTKLAICAKASSTRKYIPERLEDPEWDVWGMNDLWKVVQGADKWDAWFEVHAFSEIQRDLPEFVDWYKKQTAFPIYSLEPYPGVPRNELLDVRACLNWLRRFDPDLANTQLTDNYMRELTERDYVASAVSWMLIEALRRGQYEEIEILGVEMQAGEEYAYQRPNCTYMIGLARGLGVKVRVPEESGLLTVRWVYGVQNPPGDLGVFSECFFRSRLLGAKQEGQTYLAAESRAEGAVEACRAIMNGKDKAQTIHNVLHQASQDFTSNRDKRMRIEGIVLQLEECVERARTYNQDMRGFFDAEAARVGSPVPTCSADPGASSHKEGAA